MVDKILFDKIKRHVGHNVVAITYGDDIGDVNAAIECEDCGEVIIDADNE